MLAPSVLERIAQLKIITKRLMEGPLVGDMLTARHGYGVEFHQIRDYCAGDDVRFIDWKSTARFARLLVKECLQERNRRIIIALDVSASSRYGTTVDKLSWMRDCAAILAFAGYYVKDSVGLVLFSDVIDLEIAPSTTQAALQFLVHTVYNHHSAWGKRTHLAQVLCHGAQRWAKDAMVFVISDFISEPFDDSLRALACRLDVVAVRCLDHAEHTGGWLPDGLLVQDIETGQQVTLTAAQVRYELARRVKEQDALFASAGVDVLSMDATGDLCTQLIIFFKQRLLRSGCA